MLLVDIRAPKLLLFRSHKIVVLLLGFSRPLTTLRLFITQDRRGYHHQIIPSSLFIKFLPGRAPSIWLLAAMPVQLCEIRVLLLVVILMILCLLVYLMQRVAEPPSRLASPSFKHPGALTSHTACDPLGIKYELICFLGVCRVHLYGISCPIKVLLPLSARPLRG